MIVIAQRVVVDDVEDPDDGEFVFPVDYILSLCWRIELNIKKNSVPSARVSWVAVTVKEALVLLAPKVMLCGHGVFVGQRVTSTIVVNGNVMEALPGGAMAQFHSHFNFIAFRHIVCFCSRSLPYPEA